MASYDNDVLGVGNSMHPANQEEVCDREFSDVLLELDDFDREIVEDHIDFIERKLAEAIQRSKYMHSRLKRLSEIEQSLVVFGKLTFEEETERKEILNQYS